MINSGERPERIINARETRLAARQKRIQDTQTRCFKIVSQANLQQRMNSVMLFVSEKWQNVTNQDTGTMI